MKLLTTTRIRRQSGNSTEVLNFGLIPPEVRRQIVRRGIKRIQARRLPERKRLRSDDTLPVVAVGDHLFRIFAEPAKSLLTKIAEKADELRDEIDEYEPTEEGVPRSLLSMPAIRSKAQKLAKQFLSMSPPQTKLFQPPNMSPRLSSSVPSTLIVKTRSPKDDVVKEVVIRTNASGDKKIVRRSLLEGENLTDLPPAKRHRKQLEMEREEMIASEEEEDEPEFEEEEEALRYDDDVLLNDEEEHYDDSVDEEEANEYYRDEEDSYSGLDEEVSSRDLSTTFVTEVRARSESSAGPRLLTSAPAFPRFTRSTQDSLKDPTPVPTGMEIMVAPSMEITPVTSVRELRATD